MHRPFDVPEPALRQCLLTLQEPGCGATDAWVQAGEDGCAATEKTVPSVNARELREHWYPHAPRPRLALRASLWMRIRDVEWERVIE